MFSPLPSSLGVTVIFLLTDSSTACISAHCFVVVRDTEAVVPDTGVVAPDTGVVAPDTGFVGVPETGVVAPETGT